MLIKAKSAWIAGVCGQKVQSSHGLRRQGIARPGAAQSADESAPHHPAAEKKFLRRLPALTAAMGGGATPIPECGLCTQHKAHETARFLGSRPLVNIVELAPQYFQNRRFASSVQPTC